METVGAAVPMHVLLCAVIYPVLKDPKCLNAQWEHQ